MNDDWIALKHRTNEYGQWSISPRAFFSQHGFIPDGHANLLTPGLEEVADHTLQVLDDSDGRERLVQAGFTIEDNPMWYFERPGYVPDE